MEDWLRQLLEGNGVILLYCLTLLILIVCGLGVPVPEELTFLLAGWAAAKIGGNVWILCVVGVVGIMLGDSLPFFAGRKYGLNVLNLRFFARFLSPRNIERTQAFFRKHGSKTIFLARFIAGLRMPTFFMAGTMGVGYRSFFCWDLAGALLSCPTSIILAYYYGEKVRGWLAESHVYMYCFFGLLATYLVFHIWSHRERPKAAGNESPVTPPKQELSTPAGEVPKAGGTAPVQQRAEAQK